MKWLVVLSVIACVTLFQSCEDKTTNQRLMLLEEQVSELSQTVRPSLGLFMNQLQVYHAKLYYALQQDNRPLTAFIIHEMEERLEEIVIVHKVHDSVPVAEIAKASIFPALEDMAAHVRKGTREQLMEDFDFVTVTCNKCHEAAGHDYIRIVSPIDTTYLNQDFTRL